MKWFVWVLIVSGLAKAFDAVTLYGAWSTASMWTIAALIPLLHERIGMAVLAVVAISSAQVALPSMGSHVVLLGSVAAVFAVFGDQPTRLLLVRTQLVAVYLFAGVSKVSPEFLSGDVIAWRQPWLPAPQALAIAAVAMELWLALAVFRRWPAALPVAALLHVGIIVGMARNFNQGLELVVFNGFAFAMVLLVIAQRDSERIGGTPLPLPAWRQ